MLVGGAVHCWFIQELNPSAAAQVDHSDYTAQARIVGMVSVTEATQEKQEDVAQQLVRQLRSFAHCRAATVVGTRPVTGVLDHHTVFETMVSAVFYALQLET